MKTSESMTRAIKKYKNKNWNTIYNKIKSSYTAKIQGSEQLLKKKESVENRGYKYYFILNNNFDGLNDIKENHAR